MAEATQGRSGGIGSGPPVLSGLLAGRRMLVTGGASGIGAEVVETCSRMGASGVVMDLPETSPGGSWPSMFGDVSDEAQVATTVAAAADRLGGLDAVVAAAGIVPAWHLPDELDLDEWDRVLAVNVRGVAAVIKHAAPVLTAGSAITVIGSLNSWRGDANIPAYVASKHAVLGVVRSAALALGRSGIRVNAVAPGPIATAALRLRMRSRAVATGLSENQALARAADGTALGRLATTQDVAYTVAFLTSTLAGAITGALVPVDGGIL